MRRADRTAGRSVHCVRADETASQYGVDRFAGAVHDGAQQPTADDDTRRRNVYAVNQFMWCVIIATAAPCPYSSTQF